MITTSTTSPTGRKIWLIRFAGSHEDVYCAFTAQAARNWIAETLYMIRHNAIA